VQLFPGAGQHLGLDVEFFPRDQIHPGKHAAHQGSHILFHILGGAGGDQGADLVADVFERLGIKHDVSLL